MMRIKQCKFRCFQFIQWQMIAFYSNSIINTLDYINSNSFSIKFVVVDFVCLCVCNYVYRKQTQWISNTFNDSDYDSDFKFRLQCLNRVPNLYHTFHKCNIVHIISSMFSFTSKRIRSLLKRNLNLNDNCGIDLTRFIHDYCI